MFDEAMIESSVDVVDVGDYLLYNDSDEVVGAIEYKTYSDFVSSIMNGHLESQLVDMDNYTHPYLFIVGSYGKWLKYTHGAIHFPKKSIDGFRVKTLCVHKTKLIEFDSEPEALNAMLMILGRSNSAIGDVKLPERKRYTGNPQLDMFLSIPNIGMSKAKQYSEKMSFYEFLTCCKTGMGDPRMYLKKTYDLTVPNKIVEYCKLL